MPWYRTGTVSVTNGSAVVTGSGTAFVSNIQIGDAIRLPDNKLWEVKQVNSDTQLTLQLNYTGGTASAQAYEVVPTRGYIRDLALNSAALLQNFTLLKEAITATSDGKVSIGGAAISDRKLTVRGTAAGGVKAEIANDSTDAAAFSQFSLSSTGGGSLGQYAFGPSYVSSGPFKASGATIYGTGTGGLNLASDNGPTVFHVGPSLIERVRIATDGNVGIGTQAPSVKLHVAGDTIAAAHATQPGTYNIGFFGRVPAGGTMNWDIKTNDATYGAWTPMTITGGGYVGIGTTNPQSRLHVSGAVSIDGYGGANVVQDVTITRTSSGTAIQTGPNITFGDTTASNTITIQNSQGNLDVWNYGGGAWAQRFRVSKIGDIGLCGPGTVAITGYRTVTINGDVNGSVLDLTQGGTMRSRMVATSSSASFESGAGLPFVWLPAGSEKMRLTVAGSLIMSSATTGPVTTPNYLSFATDYSNNTLAENCKLYLFRSSGANFFGFGVGSNADVQYHAEGAGGSSGNHRFYCANVLRAVIDVAGTLRPGGDNVQTLGWSGGRWSVVYAGTGTINTSDERAKQDISVIPDEWLDAWGDVEWTRYKFKDAVAAKGDDARWHVGLIAQRVRDAFAARDLDAYEIGLLCYDEWGETIENEEVVQEAGDRFGLRYEECLAMEAAWNRRELSTLRARLAALESPSVS
jgi:hypothetical protein